MALINLSSVVELFSEEISVFKKGENCLESGNVIEVQYDGTLKIIRGRVVASMKKKSYQVEINLTELLNVESVQCDCARGQYKCHHICAILLYANKNLSKTDSACQWKAPTSSTEKTTSVSELFPKGQYRATNRKVNEADKDFFFNQLKAINSLLNEVEFNRVFYSWNCLTKYHASSDLAGYFLRWFYHTYFQYRFSGFFWLLSPEQHVQTELKSFAKILELSKNTTGEITKDQVLENFKISSAEIFEIAKITCGQNENPMWHQMRLGRLTASNFGAVLDSCQRERYPASLYSRLLRKGNLDGIKSIQWGLNHEATALREYENIESVKVNLTGLWLHGNGFLGGSPDGLVGEDIIIEIKCPFSHRNSTLEEIKLDKKYCFDENLNLKKSHAYFHQIQGLLHITKRSLCHLVVWTPTLYIKIVVVKEKNWEENLLVLGRFYVCNLLDKLLE